MTTPPTSDKTERLRYVRQEHVNGCAVAAVAMIAGLSYAETLDRLGPVVRARVERDGMQFLDTFTALQRLGYAVAPEWRGEYGRPRPEWKPQPIGRVNLAEASNAKGAHMLVALGDGTVLDPWDDGPHSLDDYQVNWIAAVVPLRVPAEQRVEEAHARDGIRFTGGISCADCHASWFADFDDRYMGNRAVDYMASRVEQFGWKYSYDRVMGSRWHCPRHPPIAAEEKKAE